MLYSGVSFDMMRPLPERKQASIKHYPVVGFPSDHKGADCKSAVIDFKV